MSITRGRVTVAMHRNHGLSFISTFRHYSSLQLLGDVRSVYKTGWWYMQRNGEIKK